MNNGMAKRTVRVLVHFVVAATVFNVALWGGSAGVAWFAAYRIGANETVLRDELRMMRKMLDQYTADHERAPKGLRELVVAGYLAEIPVDPMTGSADTWQVVLEEYPLSVTGERGIIDVKSGSNRFDSRGVLRYSDW